MNNTPDFFDLLSDLEKSRYMELKKVVSSDNMRYNRYKRIKTFKKIMRDIRYYCERNIEESCIGYVICGICWLNEEEIAINTHQLRLLLGKGKSTINGVIAKMGYITPDQRYIDENILNAKIPILSSYPQQQRQWTIRRRIVNIEDVQTKSVTESLSAPPQLAAYEPGLFDRWKGENYEREFDSDEMTDWSDMTFRDLERMNESNQTTPTDLRIRIPD
jgi:hypothetical protein